MRLPLLAYLWLAVEIALIALGGFAVQRPRDAYDAIDGGLSALGVEEHHYRRLDENAAGPMAFIGAAAVAVALVAALARQSAGDRRAMAAEFDELVWIEKVRDDAGPALRELIRATPGDRPERLADLIALVLTVSSRRWTGRRNRGDISLAYYRYGSVTSAGCRLTLADQYPPQGRFAADVTHPELPHFRVTARRRFGRFRSAPARPFANLRGSVVLIPVGSPLEYAPTPFGVVIIGFVRRRAARQVSEAGGQFLADWLGAAEVAGRGTA